MNDLNLLEVTFFKMLKYGNTDEVVISLIRHGFSKGVSELILNKYQNYVDIENGVVSIRLGLIDEMRNQGERILQLFEVEMNTPSNN